MTLESPDTTSDGKQAFLVIGDSTSAGSNNSTGNGPAPVSGTAYYYRRATTDIVEMTADIVAAPLGSQYPQFCTSYFNGSGKKAVIIPTGVGASNFSPDGDTNDWSTTGDNYAPAVTDARNTLALLGLTKLKAIFICSLGINDARGSAVLSTIQSDITSLLTRLQSDFPDVPIIMEQIGRDETASLTARIGAIRGYIKTAVIANPNVYLLGGLSPLFSNGGYGVDNLHPNQTGNNWRGEQMARWMLNSTRSKWSRSIISSMYDELSSSRKDAISTLIDNNLTDYLEHDILFMFKTTIVNNIYVDWGFLGLSAITNSPTFTANDNLATNGTSSYFRDGFNRSFLQLKSSQNDTFGAVKIKTNNTAAGTLATAYGGSNGTSAVLIQQTAASLLGYRINDNTATTSNSETVFANNAEYLFGRNGTGKFLYKDGVQVGTATQASVSVNTTQSYVGAFNSNGTANTFLNGTFEYIRAGKFTTINHATFKAAMDTFLASW